MEQGQSLNKKKRIAHMRTIFFFIFFTTRESAEVYDHSYNRKPENITGTVAVGELRFDHGIVGSQVRIQAAYGAIIGILEGNKTELHHSLISLLVHSRMLRYCLPSYKCLHVWGQHRSNKIHIRLDMSIRHSYPVSSIWSHHNPLGCSRPKMDNCHFLGGA